MILTSLDQVIAQFDRSLRVICAPAKMHRPNPAQSVVQEFALSEAEKKHSAGLMRVNHVGEICAQALYDSQAVFARSVQIKTQFAQSSIEEEDHLAWTAQRLQELNSHTSYLNPLWYAGAFALGLVAGKVGDAISLGLVVETEKQVEAHLASHLEKLPEQDVKSRAIVEQMRRDEIEHGHAAQHLGAIALPLPIQIAMKGMAKVMTTTAYYI